MKELVARFDYAIGPNQSPGVALALARVLMQPCFDVCGRLSVKQRDRQIDYMPKTLSQIAEYIMGPKNDAVVLDNGRQGDLIATIQIHTGRTAVPNPQRPVQLLSFVIVPLDISNLTQIVDSICEMAMLLRAVSGVVTVEESFGRAHGFALSIVSDRSRDVERGSVTEERLKERAAHYLYNEQLPMKIAAPEWGLFLSAGHLKVLPPTLLEQDKTFSVVRVLSSELVYLQITDDPHDVLAPNFDRKLSKAREVLRPILMDVSDLPYAAWH